MAYQPTPTTTEGGQQKVLSFDDNVNEVLRAMLSEIRMMNTHLSVITGLENEDENN